MSKQSRSILPQREPRSRRLASKPNLPWRRLENLPSNSVSVASIPVVQRQALAGDIGRMRGNGHFQKYVSLQKNGDSSQGEQPVQSAPETKKGRMAYVMNLLMKTYGYPEIGAAGLVGNLFAESGLLPNRIEGSKAETPLRAKDYSGKTRDFTPEEAMNRKYGKQGPKKPGIGLAQWTTAARRKGLFEHEYDGAKLGAAILNNLDAQVDYLVAELASKYKSVNAKLKSASSVEEASDEVVFNFERPASVLMDRTDKEGKKMSGKTLRNRDDPAVQDVLNERRSLAREAREAAPAALFTQPQTLD